MIPFNRFEHTGTEIAALKSVLKAGTTAGNGPAGKSVELLLREHSLVPNLLTTSGTHAIEMATLLFNIRPGDEVVLPSYTFVSLANAFALRGAKIIFTDVEPETLNIGLENVKQALSEKTRVVGVVNYGGAGTDLLAIRRLCDDNAIWLLEDNAHGLFGESKDGPLGSFGHVSITSFHQTKNFSCGEGGAIFFNDESLSERAEILREKGTNRSKFNAGVVDKYSWEDLGSSWVLSDALAALLIDQIESKEYVLEARRRIWDSYREGLSEWAAANQILIPLERGELQNTGHLFFVILENQTQRNRFIEHMKNRGVTVAFHYQSLHRSRFAKLIGAQASPANDFSISDLASDCLVRLPIFRSLSTEKVQQVIHACLEFTC